jgi:Ca2+-binding RTX toxin-like protein
MGRRKEQEGLTMRARNGNMAFMAGTGNDNLDFTALEQVNGPNGVGYGIDYINRGGADRVIGTRFDDSFTLSASAETIDGAGGYDVVDYSHSTAAVTVDLNVTVQSGGFAQNDRLTNIEDVIGSDYSDRLTGNALANVLMGGGGKDTLLGGGGADTLDGGADADTLDGGSGNDTLSGGLGNDRLIAGTGTNSLDGGLGTDTVDYSTSSYAIATSIETGTGYELRNFNGDMLDLIIHADENLTVHDTLTAVENLTGSAYGDILNGGDGANTLLGNAGDDFIYGHEGADNERGGTGNDHIGSLVVEDMFGPGVAGVIDDSGDDQIYGEAGDDILVGGSGADRMDGGSGFDTVDYSWSPNSIIVDLNNGTTGGPADSWSTGDTLFSIESVIGSQFTDLMFGSTNADTLDGSGGHDMLVANSGNDVLFGGAGNDSIEGCDDDDQMTGGAGTDTFVFRVAPSATMLSPEAGDGHDTTTSMSARTSCSFAAAAWRTSSCTRTAPTASSPTPAAAHRSRWRTSTWPMS